MIKQTMGWTRPKVREPEAADRWTRLVIAAHPSSARPARSLPTYDAPGRKPFDPNKLTPARVRRGFRNLPARLPSPSAVPTLSRPGPGRPPGSRNQRSAARHDVGLELVTGQPYLRSAHPKTGTNPRRGACFAIYHRGRLARRVGWPGGETTEQEAAAVRPAHGEILRAAADSRRCSVLTVEGGLLCGRLSDELPDPEVALDTATTILKELARDFHDTTVEVAWDPRRARARQRDRPDRLRQQRHECPEPIHRQRPSWHGSWRSAMLTGLQPPLRSPQATGLAGSGRQGIAIQGNPRPRGAKPPARAARGRGTTGGFVPSGPMGEGPGGALGTPSRVFAELGRCPRHHRARRRSLFVVDDGPCPSKGDAVVRAARQPLRHSPLHRVCARSRIPERWSGRQCPRGFVPIAEPAAGARKGIAGTAPAASAARGGSGGVLGPLCGAFDGLGQRPRRGLGDRARTVRRCSRAV